VFDALRFMTLNRASLTILFLAVPCAAAWNSEQKGWSLATSGIVTQLSNLPQGLLFRTEQSPATEEEARNLLAGPWRIRTRDELLSTIDSLLQDHGNRMELAWNYSRAVNLARWGYGANFLSEDETWNLIVPAAQRLQLSFGSWQELGLAYLNARSRWYTNEDTSRRAAEYAYRVLLTDPAGPWRKYPWNLDLGNGQHVPPSAVKTAWLEIAAHPAGLICVRLGVPDHTAAERYDSAIEEAVGCHPQITGERHNGPDLILDTECVRSGTLRGSQVVADFHLEPIAEQLRREGVTQLFTYIENITRGDSNVFPKAYDSWVENSWQWHVDYRSLRRPLPDITLIYGIPPRDVQVFVAAAGFFVIASLLGAWMLRHRDWASYFPTLFWGSWIVLTISFHGLAIAGFRSGKEGIGADVQTLIWYGAAALLLRAVTGVLIWPELRAAVSRRQALEISLSRSLAEIPFAIVLVLLCNPHNPLNLATLIVMLAMAAASAFIAWHLLRLALGEKGGSVQDGELHDAVFATARRLHVRLRRLYIQPENIGPRVAPSVGSNRDLMIPERLLRAASRREINSVVTYELMLIKKRHLKDIWVTLVPILVVFAWRAYLYQTSGTENFTLLREAGIMMSAFGAFQKSQGKVQSGAEKAFLAAGGDAEGWIACLARIARLAGTRFSAGLFEGIAKRCGVARERVPILIEVGFPETGHYAIPSFKRDKLDLFS